MDVGCLAPQPPVAQVETDKGGCEQLLLSLSPLKVSVPTFLPSWLKLSQGQEYLAGWVLYPGADLGFVERGGAHRERRRGEALLGGGGGRIKLN